MAAEGLKRLRKQKHAELKRMQGHRTDIINLISVMNTAFSDNIEDVNTNVTKSSQSISMGAKALAQIEMASNNIFAKRESYSDDSMENCKTNLNQERERAEKEIDRLENEIRDLDRRIAAAEAAEEAARRAEEAAKAAADATARAVSEALKGS